jgi:BASS family bile acid:Na+ symporter
MRAGVLYRSLLLLKSLARTLPLVTAIALGALIPQAHVFSPVIRWIVMTMLFLIFLQTKFSRSAVHRSHVVLLFANFALAFVAWGIGWFIGGREMALTAFFAGITPTAIAAPVITSFLGGNVSYVVAAFLLTNLSVAAAMPLLLPLVLGRATPEAFTQVAGSVGFVVFLPLIASRVVRAVHPRAAEWPPKLRNFSFGIWVVNLFLITANASYFLHQQVDTPHVLLAKIALVSLVVCALNFSLGRLIGGKEFAREASQALGQKNTAFTIYLALAYASPVVALGPTCYVLWHNLWNSWQLHRAGKK